MPDFPLLQVIFKVYEEKEQTWQKEYMKLRTQYESSLLVYQKKALKADEQLLLLTQQVSRGTACNEHLICINAILSTKQGKEEKVRSEKEVQDLRSSNLFLEQKIAEMSLEMDAVRDRLTESEWKLQSEALRVRQQSGREVGREERPCGGFPAELETTIQMLRDEVQDLLQERKSGDAAVARLRQENEDLRYELGNVREELNTTREGMAEERDQWQKEKEKVLRYQKQLNQNYILVLKRNKEIESELKALRDKTSYKIITDETKC